MLTLAYVPGDGIGPEIMDATRSVIDKVTKGTIEWDEVRSTDFHPPVHSEEAYRSLVNPGVVLKAPIHFIDHSTMPWGDEALCKYLRISTRVRLCRYLPDVPGSHRQLDLAVVSEINCDEYAFGQTIQYAIHLAHTRQKKITLVLQTNQHWSLLLHKMRMFDDLIKQEGEGLRVERWSLRSVIGRLHTWPGSFDVIVTDTFCGDVLSAQGGALMGGVGLTSCESFGNGIHLFETGHGTAPGLAGQGVANPSGLLFAGASMLEYLGLSQEAERLTHALLRTFGNVRTRDIGGTASTAQFIQAVLAKL